MNPFANVLLVGVQWGPYVPLGLLFVAEAVRSVCTVRVVFGDPHDDDIAWADLVGVSSSSFGIDAAVRVALRCADAGRPSVLGGIHGTFATLEMLASGFTYVIRGEGEGPLISLIRGDASACARVVGETVEVGPVHSTTDLSLGYAGEHLRAGFWGTGYSREGRRYELGPLVTSRGCRHSCLFCTVPATHPTLRLQTLASVERQIDAITLQGYGGVRIYDSIFGLNRRHGAAVARRLGAAGLAWIAETTVGAARHEDLLRTYAANGCIKLEFGLETTDPDLLRRYQKPFDLELATHTITLAQRLGIQVETYLVVGGPGETDREVDAVCRWFETVMPDNLSISVLAAYPGTELNRLASEEGFGTIHPEPIRAAFFETAGNGERYAWIAPGGSIEENIRRATRIYDAWRSRGGENPWVADRRALLEP